MIKLIIFDLDGVIIRGEFFSTRFEKAYNVPSSEVFEVLKKEILDPAKPTPCFPIWKIYLKKWNIKLSEDQFWHFWFSEDGQVDQDIIKLIKSIRDQVKTVLLSDNFKERVDWLYKTYDFWPYFDKICFSAEIGYPKKSEIAFKQILDYFNLPPEQVLIIDDSDSVLSLAKELKINTHKFEDYEKLKGRLEEFQIIS